MDFKYKVENHWMRDKTWTMTGTVSASSKVEAVKKVCQKYDIDLDQVVSMKPNAKP